MITVIAPLPALPLPVWLVTIGTLVAVQAAATSRAEPPVTRDVEPRAGVPWSGPAERTLADAFDPDPDGAAPLTVEELQRRLSPVTGQAGRILAAPAEAGQQRPRGTVQGTFRVRGMWCGGSALRFATDGFRPLLLHVWSGREGVAIHYRPQPPFRPPAVLQSWTAARISRDEAGTPAAIGPLLATDEGRGWRASPAAAPACEVSWTGDSLVLGIGGTAVLEVPFNGLPDDIDLHCEEAVAFRQIVQVAALPLPAAGRPLAPARETIDLQQCSWNEALPAGATFIEHADGGRVLRAQTPPAPARASVPLPRIGLAEVVLTLDDVVAGSGVFLGDERGRPLFGIAFVSDPASKQTVARSMPSVGARVAAWSPQWGIQPVVGRRVWLRMLPAAGTMKFWVSADGVTWAELTEAQGPPPRAWSSIGLFCLHEYTATIRIRGISLHPLPAIDSLVPAGLLETAAGLPEIGDGLLTPADWRARVEATRPPAAAADAWRRACAIVRLGAGVDEGFGTALVRSLVEDALRHPPPTEDAFRLLDDAVRLLPNHGAPATAQEAADLYVRLGEQLRRAGDSRPYTTVAGRLAVAPIWSRAAFDTLAEPLLRAEIIELASAGRWPELAESCRAVQGRFRGRSLPLVAWGAAVARWSSEAAAGEQPIPWSRSPWAMLGCDVAKSDAGDVATWQAEVDRGAFADAYRLAGTVDAFGLNELRPDTVDSHLATTWPVVIEAALGRDAGIAAAMRPAFPPLAPVRLAQAIDGRDATALDLATVHFFGTPEAARAHLWLGDRHLLLGEPERAMGRYRRARLTAPPQLLTRISASEALAEAMSGRSGPAPAVGLDAGGERLSAAGLVDLVEQTRRLAAVPEAAIVRVPAAAGFRGLDRSVFPAQDALVAAPERFETQGVDLVARHTSLTVAGSRLIVADRGRAAAYDLASGGPLWESAAGRDAARPGDAAALPGTAVGSAVVRPLVSRERVFLRRLTKEGWVLVCLEGASGKTLWGTDIQAVGAIVSDPVLVEDRLHVVTLSVTLANQGVVHLTSFDPQEGGVLARRMLARFQEPQRSRQAWFDDRHDFGVTSIADTLVAAGCGAVLCCDLAGTPRWVRHEIAVPPDLDPNRERFTQDRPILADGRLVVTQAGVWSVICLDPATGRLLWRRFVPDMRRLLAAADGRVIVATDDSFLALDVETGAELWRHESGPRLGGELCGPPGGLVYAVADRITDKPPSARPCLVWVDPAVGRPVARWPLQGRERERPAVGPFCGEDGRLWMLEGELTAKRRSLVALLPEGEPQPMPTGIE